MKDKIVELIENKKGRYKAEELADEIIELHNKEMEKFANQLGISTAPADYFEGRKVTHRPGGKTIWPMDYCEDCDTIHTGECYQRVGDEVV